MRVLVTGGFGFVGARLGVHLHRQGHDVILASRTANGPPAWLPEAGTVRLDWQDRDGLAAACRSVDAIVHAAGMNAEDCAKDPVAALEVNGVATARLVAAAARSGVERFVYVSTAHVYDAPLVGHISEETCPRNLHPYASSHLAGETAVLHLAQQGSIDGIVVRLSNAFGRPEHPATNCWMLLVNELCRSAICNGSLALRSNGRQLRDFVPMADVCTLLEGFVTRGGDGTAQRVFNVGAARSLAVIDMATKIQERCVHLWGCRPDLRIPDVPAAAAPPEPLSFSCRNLGGNAADFDQRLCAEIDGLLQACNNWFDFPGKREI